MAQYVYTMNRVGKIVPPKRQILKDVSLSFFPGAKIGVLGLNGSGKSTLLYQLGLLDMPSSGEVFIDGKDLVNAKENFKTHTRLNDLGYIFQDYAILPSLTALENTMLPLLMQGYTTKSANIKAKKALEKVGLADRMHNLPSQLSGGQQQRVAVARALINNPAVIFADDPSGNLDHSSAENLHELFFKLRDEFGQTFVIVTHNEELANMADRKLVMIDGVLQNQ